MVGYSLGVVLPLFQQVVYHVSQLRNGELIREHLLLCRLYYWLGVLEVQYFGVDIYVEDTHLDFPLYHPFFLDVSSHYFAGLRNHLGFHPLGVANQHL